MLKILKRLALGAIIAGQAMTFSCDHNIKHYADELTTLNGLEYRIGNQLMVNTDDNIRYIVKKPEEEGIEDMQRLLVSSQFEECYLYFPVKELWVEIGQRQRIQNDVLEFGSYLGLDSNEMANLIKEQKKAICYHLQPALDSLFHEHYSNMKSSDLKAEFVKHQIRTCLPTPKDLCALILLSKNFLILNPTVDIEYKICSQYGIAEYHLTEKGQREFIPKTKEEIVLMACCYYLMKSPTLCVSNSDYPVDIKKKALEGSAILSGECFSVKFTPY